MGLIRRTFDVTARGFLFWCPGCEAHHEVSVEQANERGARWTYDGNAAAPTFTPSVVTSWLDADGKVKARCHLFVRAGRLEFLPDSTHRLAGQTVDMEPLPTKPGAV